MELPQPVLFPRKQLGNELCHIRMTVVKIDEILISGKDEENAFRQLKEKLTKSPNKSSV